MNELPEVTGISTIRPCVLYTVLSRAGRSEFRAYALGALAVRLRSENSGMSMAEAANGGGELHTAKTSEKRTEQPSARYFHVRTKRRWP